MEKEKEYFKYLDFVRIFLCISIVLYHLDILKGGYLAVCSFFVLSGYLSVVSLFKKDKVSLLKYYKNRLTKIYLPLLIVVFLTIAVLPLFKNIILLNLKPEVTSVLLSYNNFWQLSANLDYFAHHINSPFMHLWYISILIQFDIVFPLIFILFKKMGEKIKKIIPIILGVLLSIGSCAYFYYASRNLEMMVTYYSTFTRLFSLVFGVTLGFIACFYKKDMVITKREWLKKLIFLFYLLALFGLFIFIPATSKYFAVAMILASVITLRLISYSVSIKKAKDNRLVKFFANISYEVYLVQYPIIYYFQYLNLECYYKYPLIVLLILVLSFIINFAVRKNESKKVFRWILRVILILAAAFGLYKFIITPDNSKELKELENQLSQNEQMILDKQKEYEQAFKEEENKILDSIEKIEEEAKNIDEVIKNLPVVGIGDSVMLGATPGLYKQFSKGYFDAKISRTTWEVSDILKDLTNRNLLSNIVVIGLGTNGECKQCRVDIMEKLKNSEVFWLNVTNDDEVHINEGLNEFAEGYDNLHVIDWNSISSGHKEYFYADGIHLTEPGIKAYVEAIYEAIKNTYLEKLEKQKQDILDNHDKETKNRITFYGNDILLGAFELINYSFENSNFKTDSNYTYDLLKSNIKTDVDNNKLTNKIVLIFDKKMYMDKERYEEIINLCNDSKVYLVLTSNIDIDNTLENVVIINFYEELEANEDYLMSDKVHLTDSGYKALVETLKNNIDLGS